MISIVICSIQPELAAQVSRNITETIGVPHEIIVYDNQNTGLGITAVYNNGVRASKFPIVCFVHEDVLFTTLNWGKVLIDHFRKFPNTGAIGLAGGKYKAATPSGWYTGLKPFDCSNITHLSKSGKEQFIRLAPDQSQPRTEVVTIDGVFICTTKDNLRLCPWDEQNLFHFHFYDIDFSFRLFLAGKTNYVSYEIGMVHLTEGGSFDNHWVSEALAWHARFADKLPAAIAINSASQFSRTWEKQICQTWLLFLRRWPIKKSLKIRWFKAIHLWKTPALWPYAVLFWLRLRLTREKGEKTSNSPLVANSSLINNHTKDSA